MVTLHSIEEIIEALGGMKAVSTMTGRRDARAVWNWKDRGAFPASTYAVLKGALNNKGFDAPASLWRNMAEATP